MKSDLILTVDAMPDVTPFQARSSFLTIRDFAMRKVTLSSGHRQCTALSAIPCRSMQIGFPDTMGYTFGDNQQASRRLHRLAEVYESETRDLLNAVRSEFCGLRFELALDLGCGPGWSTQLIKASLSPKRTVGLDASESYIAEARINQPQLEFIRHDVLMMPFPLDNADLIFCRFLLTHLPSPHAALETWYHAARSGALLVIHETEALHSTHPVLLRYYEMLAQMQKHYGQEMNVGALLTDALTCTSWSFVYNESVVLKKSARDMAQLHLANLRTWRHNDFAVQVFDRHEIDHLETQLASIACGSLEAGVVYNTARRIVAQRN